MDHGPCFILVKRSVSGKERTGLVVAIDLEEMNSTDLILLSDQLKEQLKKGFLQESG